MGRRESDEQLMKIALEEARKAANHGEVPIGAVLVKGERILAKDHNRCIQLNDPTAHAEILVLRKGGRLLKNYRLNHTNLYVTAEPCLMCASAMVHARISRLVFGAWEKKFGAVGSNFKLFEERGLNHQIEVQGGILEKKCSDLLRDFFKKKRGK